MIPEVVVQNALNEYQWELVDSDLNFLQHIVAFKVNCIFTVFINCNHQRFNDVNCADSIQMDLLELNIQGPGQNQEAELMTSQATNSFERLNVMTNGVSKKSPNILTQVVHLQA
jgi:hypothetical protein